ncbi:AzlC family ABC transporter permease [Suttonella sp. R2A3]|uniref:AzlC family ABC transporter permease n=1 Tax=Suttonella sp. R2A3 TaxID=2908648 RepID=UPI001F1C0842|nr:AzlC family ABC transporter permease [Suttonella sp. R2A3]UJF25056.1 AzlC family ABC transporter permease [Suttonella sp. R2A3]
MKHNLWRQALVLSLPVMMGYLPLGMAYAVLWVKADLPWAYGLLASVLLYAGAMQFLLVGLFAAGADLAQIALVTLAVNVRHVFYGLSYPVAALLSYRWARYYAMFSLTDEAYSLVAQQGEDADGALLLRIQLLCQSYWVLGSALGLGLGMLIPPSVIGFDFALSALFVVLAQAHFYHHNRRLAMLMGLVAMIFAFALFDDQMLSMAIVGFLVLLIWHPRARYV